MIGKHKNKIIAAVAVVAILAAAWFFTGNAERKSDVAATATPSAVATVTATAIADETTEIISPSASAETPTATEIAEVSASPVATENVTASPIPTEIASPEVTPESTPEPTPEQILQPTPTPEQDKYQTDPIPSGKPAPVEPQDATISDGSFIVSLSVECKVLIDNLDKLDKNKRELVPADGVIFPATDVTVYEGESVFNVLQREMKRAKIHFEFVNTPIYNSAYIEGINNLYEFDAGELSGWMYKVNGWFPNYGCSRYQLKQGDVVEWIFTCDLGRDIGGSSADGEWLGFQSE